MGRKEKRGAGQPLSRRAWFLIQLAFIGFLAFIPTCGTMGAFPVGTRVVAPLVCPSDTDHSVVTARWSGSSGSKGGVSIKWDLYCVSAEGFGTIPSTGKIVLALVVVYGGLAGLLLLLLRLRWFLKNRSQGGQPDAA